MAKRGANLLDDLQIKRWLAAAIPIAKSDGSGLTFTLSKAGTASWILRYMREGRPKELTLGNYPDISLAAARRTARAKRVEIDEGHDPAATKKTERGNTKRALTINQLITDYIAKKHAPGQLAKSTIDNRMSDFKNTIIPGIGSMEIRRVTAAEIINMLEKSKRSWVVQNRALTSTSLLFDHAIGKQIVLTNPCAVIKLTALLGKRPVARKRIMLTEIELRTLLSKIHSIGAENALAFKIMLATCVRSGELVKAKWEDIDLARGTWFVPAESVKTRVGFTVTLTPVVAGWFRNLQELAEESVWVLPARKVTKLGKHVACNTLSAAITRLFVAGEVDVRRFTPHDTRSTAKGHMRNLGVSREASELALNHALKGMEGIYDVRDEIPERRVALEKWAAFIVACEEGVPWNVTPINKASIAA